jgi:CheY-like chemotaxis protein
VKTVLIVDDDEDFHEALEAALARRGFSVRHAGNGGEALARLADGARPDVILIDLMMPVLDGWQLLEALSRDPALAAIPAAVMSASPNPAGLPAGVPRLPKPCDLRQLLELLDQLCA